MLNAVPAMSAKLVLAAFAAIPSHPVHAPVMAPGDVAVRFASAQVGRPYVPGGTGRYGFDCSGLTYRAWRVAGRPIPRSADAQWRSLPSARGKLRRGDLVFKVSGGHAYHVAMYAGGGRVVVARHSGTRLTRQPLWGYWSAGGVHARRPR